MSDQQAFEFATRIEKGIAFIDLNRPEEGNSLTRGMMVQLAHDLRALGARPDIQVIAIEGRGAVFCKGRDGRGENSAAVSAYEMRKRMMGPVLDVYAAISDVPVPVVACVHGAAVGFGAALAGACDVTLVSDAASFAFPEIEHDIPPTLAMCAVRRTISAKALAYLVYSAETIEPAQAVAFGLASRVWPRDSFAKSTQGFLEKLASRPRLILETIKRYQAKSDGLSGEMASEYAGTLMALVRSEK